MEEYFSVIAEEFGIAVWLLSIILIWSLAWKLVALGKSARKGSVVWFVVLAIFNTLGILPILYIFVFSKMKCREVKQIKQAQKKKSRKKKK